MNTYPQSAQIFYTAEDWSYLVTLLYSGIFTVVLVTCKFTSVTAQKQNQMTNY
jgi:hypothetical protein